MENPFWLAGRLNQFYRFGEAMAVQYCSTAFSGSFRADRAANEWSLLLRPAAVTDERIEVANLLAGSCPS
jgi:hypothetical protein